MDYYDVKRLALVLAVQAEIEGMKAENRQRPGDEQWTIRHFESKAEELKNLAYCHNEQL
jgi:hypothetical protein